MMMTILLQRYKKNSAPLFYCPLKHQLFINFRFVKFYFKKKMFSLCFFYNFAIELYNYFVKVY